MSITIAIIVVTLIGLLGAVVLVVASQFLMVEVDARVEQIGEILPGVNCGACGYAGCADYAEAVVKGAKPNRCIPGGATTANEVAAIMGEDAGDITLQKAVVACSGSLCNITTKYQYEGVQSCAACVELHGGSSSCAYGCLGFGDCAAACPYDAISVQDGLARINQSKCTGCSSCVAVCPKHIISIRKASAQPVVLCASHQKGAQTRKACTAGCISCMKCERSCPVGAIKVTDNVAFINQELCTSCGFCVSVCPVQVIKVTAAS